MIVFFSSCTYCIWSTGDNIQLPLFHSFFLMEHRVGHRPSVDFIFLFFPTLDTFRVEQSSQALASEAGVQSPWLVLMRLLVCDVLGPWSRCSEVPPPQQLVSLCYGCFLTWCSCASPGAADPARACRERCDQQGLRERCGLGMGSRQTGFRCLALQRLGPGVSATDSPWPTAQKGVLSQARACWR